MRRSLFKPTTKTKVRKSDEVYVQDKPGAFAMLTDSKSISDKADLGDSIGLSMQEKTWRGEQIRRPSVDQRAPAKGADLDEAEGEFGDYINQSTSSGEDECAKPTKPVRSKSVEPAKAKKRDAPSLIRVSFPSEPVIPPPPRCLSPRKRIHQKKRAVVLSSEESESDVPIQIPPRGKKANHSADTTPQPSFMRTAEIFGTAAPTPLCSDPVTQRQSMDFPSNQRSAVLSSMAETLADVFGQKERATKLSHRRLHGFTLAALRGFGNYKVSFASGVDGEQLTGALLRLPISQRRDLYRFGFRFYFTGNLRKSVSTGSFGSFSHATEKGEVILLGDFRPQHRDKLEVYHPSTVKEVRKAPETIIEFRDMASHQILFLQAIYGEENGIDRRKAVSFFLELHRDATETFTVEFTVGAWERMSIDYMEGIRDGIRRMEPYLDSGATKIALSKAALFPVKMQNRKTRTFRCDPRTWKIQSKRGYWKCAILPELERERDRNDSQLVGIWTGR